MEDSVDSPIQESNSKDQSETKLEIIPNIETTIETTEIITQPEIQQTDTPNIENNIPLRDNTENLENIQQDSKSVENGEASDCQTNDNYQHDSIIHDEENEITEISKESVSFAENDLQENSLPESEDTTIHTEKTGETDVKPEEVTENSEAFQMEIDGNENLQEETNSSVIEEPNSIPEISMEENSIAEVSEEQQKPEENINTQENFQENLEAVSEENSQQEQIENETNLEQTVEQELKTEVTEAINDTNQLETMEIDSNENLQEETNSSVIEEPNSIPEISMEETNNIPSEVSIETTESPIVETNLQENTIDSNAAENTQTEPQETSNESLNIETQKELEIKTESSNDSSNIETQKEPEIKTETENNTMPKTKAINIGPSEGIIVGTKDIMGPKGLMTVCLVRFGDGKQSWEALSNLDFLDDGSNLFVVTWIQCDSCQKWRRFIHLQDAVLPDNWYCPDNEDENYNRCDIPQEQTEQETEVTVANTKMITETKKRPFPQTNTANKKLKMEPQVQKITAASPADLSKCRTMIARLLLHKFAWVFAAPVDPVALEIPHYFSIITNPMDFGTVEQKLLRKNYKTILDFKYDVELVFNNAFTFNPPEHDVYKMAQTLKEHFNSLWDSKFPKNLEKGKRGKNKQSILN